MFNTHKTGNIMKRIWSLVLIVSFISGFIQNSFGQYFGRNKVNYEQFDFKIYETPHFEIYHYLENKKVLEDFAQLCERWYVRHQAIFLDTLEEKNPIILYNNHADFQQTTVIQSLIGVGTGGVTEGFRNRVVMPIMKSNAETNHVLGHELVHVFQYLSFKNADSIRFQSIGQIPLWMIEGLAEYMSIGKSDVQTAMWMRDAVKNDDIPTLKDMTRKPHKYFPYRYGHAIWVYITSNWGDAVIKPLLFGTAKTGYKRAVDSILGVSADTLSMVWEQNLKDSYSHHMDKKEGPVGSKILKKSDLGKINIAPSVSPNGRYMIFLSDKSVITTDFYLVDLKKNRIINKLSKVTRSAHIDDYSYLESAGTWSPDNRKFALTSFMDGKNKLIVFNIDTLNKKKIYDFPDMEFFNNPSWSPDGNSIVVSGLKNGQSDLYLLELENTTSKRLTNDRYSDLQPAWSPDGQKIAFISDRSEGTDFNEIRFGNYRVCTYDMNTGVIDSYDFFPETDNTNPQFSPDGSKLYFVSAGNGITNLYEYHLKTEDLFQLSDFYTGISGITELSPSVSVARETGQIVYIYYENKGYSMYKAMPEDFKKKQAFFGEVNKRPTVIPPYGRSLRRVVDENLDRYPMENPKTFDIDPYNPKFSLEYIGSSGIGVGFNQTSTALAGGVSLLFSDILKRNQLITSLSINGEIYDIGGQAIYINNSSRLSWGASFSHVPYRSTRAYIAPDSIESVRVTNLIYIRQRTFEDELGLFGRYPLSKNLRFEGGITGSVYSFRIDSINNYYAGGYKVDESRTKLDAPPPFFMGRTYVAFVGDDSNFGLTSPMRGYRYRFQAGRTFGEINSWDLLADYRRYFFKKPVGFAFRLMHYGRYGGNSDELYPLFIGYPYYIRGYSSNSFYKNDSYSENSLSINQLSGSKMALVNGEIRYPLSGPKRLALIKSGFLFSDLVLFFDGGMAFNDFDDIGFQWEPKNKNEQIPVFSTGISIRINLLGAIIVEPYYAIPFQRKDVEFGTFGFFLSAGGF